MFADLPLLSLLVWLPILGGVWVLAIGDKEAATARSIALVVSLLTFGLSLPLYFEFDTTTAAMQFTERYSWIPNFNIYYHLGIDGISMPLIILTTFSTVLVILAGWEVIQYKIAQYMAAFLIMNGLMVGVFAALDAILFYVLWEAMLIPMFIIIGVWGGPQRVYAAIKFFLYTFLGSVLMLIALLYLYSQANSFAILDFHQLTPIPITVQIVIFIAFFVAFAVKVPMWPVHTWLPDAHVEAPTPISVILAGVLLKMGTYGILRFNYPIFPELTQQLAWYIGLFGMINIIYGALAAMAQRDFKKLIAYSSISHMGYVLLGMASLNTMGISGAILQMFNHGTITAMLFLIVGVLYDRTHTRNLDDFGGIATQMPVYTGFVTVAFFAAIGLPGLSGFISEAFVFLGAFSYDLIRVLTIVSTLGILLGAGYMLWTMQRVYLGQLKEKWAQLKDLDTREYLMFIPLTIIIIFLGFYPSAMLDVMNSSVNTMVKFMQDSQVFFSSLSGL